MDNYLRSIDRKIDVCGKLMLRNPNIVAVGRGNKRINGEMIKNRPTLTVFVEKKLANSAIENTQSIPKIIGGIETDVYEIGMNSNKDSKVDKLANEKLITDLKPAFGGGSIAIQRKDKTHLATLTYGFINKGAKDKLYALTAGHAFTAGLNPMKPGEPVDYFRGNDAKALEKAWDLGIFIQAKSKQYVENDIDAALIYVDKNDSEGRKLIAPGIVNGKIILKTHVVTQEDINNKEKVYKVGMITGYTEGEILSIKTMRKVFYSEEIGVVINKNQICTNIKVETGDSGALGVMKRTQEAFGMQNSGGATESSFSEIDTVLKAFNLEFLT